MDVIIKRRNAGTPASQSPRLRQPSPYDKRIGEGGRVMELHSEDNTVDVLLDSGVFLKHVQVRSLEWVIYAEDSEKEYNAGERDLPPLHSRVFILMPTGTYDDCFVLCSLFSTPNKAEPFLAEDKEKIKEGISPSGWHITNDNDTGSHKAVSLDKKTSINLDYGSEKEPLDPPEFHAQLFHDEENDDPGIKIDVVSGKTVDISAFKDIKLHHEKEKIITGEIFEETNFEYNKEKGIIKGDLFEGEANLEYKKGDSISAKLFDGEATYTHKKGDSTVIKAFDSEITLKQGQVIIKTSSKITHDAPVYDFTGNTSTGTVLPKGTGVYCAIPVCPYSGLPQTG